MYSLLLQLRRLSFALLPARFNPCTYSLFFSKCYHCRVKRTTVHAAVEDFSDDRLWIDFRLRRSDISRMLVAFQLNDIAKVDVGKGNIFTGEEVFLIARYKFVTDSRFIQMASIFRRDHSELSKALKYFVNHVISKLGFLLTNNMEYWLPYFSTFAEATRAKFCSVSGLGIPSGSFRICGFHDDTCIKTSRPGAGPAVGGGRKDNNIQRACYNGAGHYHGVKYQTMEAVNGMAMHMYGPMSYRHSDLDLFRASGLNDILAELQIGQPMQYASYGDGIFPILSHCIGKHVGMNLNERERLENKFMSSMRICNEWHYGITGRYFPLVKNFYKHQLLKNLQSGRYYFVATIMKQPLAL